jgi:hypothetical protein
MVVGRVGDGVDSRAGVDCARLGAIGSGSPALQEGSKVFFVLVAFSSPISSLISSVAHPAGGQGSGDQLAQRKQFVRCGNLNPVECHDFSGVDRRIFQAIPDQQPLSCVSCWLTVSCASTAS